MGDMIFLGVVCVASFDKLIEKSQKCKICRHVLETMFNSRKSFIFKICVAEKSLEHSILEIDNVNIGEFLFVMNFKSGDDVVLESQAVVQRSWIVRFMK
jgi:hypothetical protein